MMRAIRVMIDIGMHLELEIPADSPGRAGRRRGRPELGREFFAAHGGRGTEAFIDSEIMRYLGAPGQAISYKLGERAWLAGRDAAQAARGDELRPQVLAHGGAVARFPGAGRSDRPSWRPSDGTARIWRVGTRSVPGARVGLRFRLVLAWCLRSLVL